MKLRSADIKKHATRAARALAVSGLVVLGLSKPSWSHPHEFVDMKIQVLFGSANEVSGMRYVWLFDEFFTAYAIEPADKDGDGKPEQDGLDALAVEILGNIAAKNYMTKFDQNRLVPEFGEAKPVSSTMVGRQLRLEFVAPFKKPLKLAGKSFAYAVYDDEFYIAMHHSTEKDAVVLSGAGSGCEFDLQPPNPDESLTEFASSLGRDESGGSDLGANFAEWVTISCK